MTIDPDPDEEPRALREWMNDHGLVPPVDHLLHDSDELDRIAAQITSTSRPAASQVRRRPVALAAVAAVLLVGIVVVAQPLVTAQPVTAAGTPRMLTYSIDDLQHLEQTLDAEAALNRAADRADHAEAITGTGEVQYVASYGWLLSDSSTSDIVDSTQGAVYPTTTSQWLMPDGSLDIDQQRAAALNLDGTVHPTATADLAVSGDTAPAGTYDPTLAKTLPRDPTAIAAALTTALSLTGCDTMRAQCLVTAIVTLSTTYVVPPDLTATLWRALALERDVRSLGATTDRFGTPVQAVALTTLDPDTIEVLLISTATGHLTGTETVTLRSDTLHLNTPTVTAFTAIRQTGWVQAAGQVPGA